MAWRIVDGCEATENKHRRGVAAARVLEGRATLHLEKYSYEQVIC